MTARNDKINVLCEKINSFWDKSIETYEPLYELPYVKRREIQDVDTKWYTIQVNRNAILDWIYNQPDGWRPAANLRFSSKSTFDLREDVYTWFILRWG